MACLPGTYTGYVFGQQFACRSEVLATFMKDIIQVYRKSLLALQHKKEQPLSM